MLGNWIKQTTTTTGTGALTLSTVSGYAAFSDQFASGQRFQYQILDAATGAPIESGVGYLSGGTLVRERIEATIVSGTFDNSTPSAVSLASGTKTVICGLSMSSALSTVPGTFAPSGGFRGYGDAVTAQGGGGNIALVNQRAIALPFWAVSNQEIDALVVRVTAAGTSGSLIRGAIYSVGADGLPDVKLAESGTADGTTTGQKFLTFTAFRPPQRFFGAVISTNAPSVYGGDNGVATSPLGYTSSQEAIGYVFKAGSGANFPSDWSSPSQDVYYARKPVLAVRCI
jgi:hypothetical protein